MADKKPEIVVIDDSPASISLYRRSIESLDIKLTAFQSPPDSIAYLEDNSVDLIFTGIIMRGVDGWTILKRMRALERHQDTNIIVVTSKDYAQDRALARQLGAREYLVKPLRSQEIRDVIRKYTHARPIHPE